MRSGLILLMTMVCWSAPAKSPAAKTSDKPTNKLLHMYRVYYLPFSLYFREGSSANEIVPFVDADTAGVTKRMLKAQELQILNNEWDAIRQDWKKRSLFLTTPVTINSSVKITRGLSSHRISLTRRALDGVELNDRIQLNNALQSKSPELQKAFTQLRFLKSFVPKESEDKFNMFVVSASWCQSCLEYRALLEAYAKKFADPNLVLHSVVVEDPKEEIFDSKVLEELFPFPKKYSHESIPRFLALETIEGKPVVHEEGDALKVLYHKFLGKHRGYLDNKVSLFSPSGQQRGITSSDK